MQLKGNREQKSFLYHWIIDGTLELRRKGLSGNYAPFTLDPIAGGPVQVFLESFRCNYAYATMAAVWQVCKNEIVVGKEHYLFANVRVNTRGGE